MTRTERTAILQLAAGPQLFLDDYFTGSTEGLTRTILPPLRHPRPVLAHTTHHIHRQPWLTVLYYPPEADAAGSAAGGVGGRFRLWHGGRVLLPEEGGMSFERLSSDDAVRHAYAESADGLNWLMPDLGLVEWPGWEDNNLLPTHRVGGTGYPLCVIDHGPEHAEPDKRFAMIAYNGVTEKTGAWALFSPDGFHWSSVPENPVVPYAWSYGGTWSDGRQVFVDGVEVFRDLARGRYVMTHVMCAMPEDGYVGRSRTGPIRRTVGQLESEDFLHWTEPRVILTPDSPEDMTEYYNMSIIYRNGLYIGFPRILRDDLPADPGGPVEGVGWTELAVSRDGDNWTRLPGKLFDRDHDTDAWDHAMAWSNPPVYVGNEMFFYYAGYNQGHKVGRRQIGLARSARDRFLSLEAAGGQPGLLVSKPFCTDCGFMTLNAAVTGSIRVELRDAAGAIPEGYAFEDCDPAAGDSPAHPVRWRGRCGLPPVKGEGLVAAFALDRAHLFAVDLL